MSVAPHVVPTLTEVVEIALDDARGMAALPLGPDAMPLDEFTAPAAVAPGAPVAEPVPTAFNTDAVLEQLQVRLDAWLAQRLAAELEPALRAAIDRAAAAVAAELRSELPTLVRDALQAVQRSGHPPAGTLR